MMKIYHDYYGGTASIREHCGHYVLKCRTCHGDIYHHKSYKTFRGAKIALGRITEGMYREV